MKEYPTISLPQGVRDILPEEAARITEVEASTLSVFAEHGFRKVITPLLEYVDVLSLGTGDTLRERVIKFIDPSTGRVVAIRPDITPQIARVVATRMRDAEFPVKLCYNENVLRHQEDGKARELLQVGAEYVSEAQSAEADAEMVVTAVEALRRLGLEAFKIDIGDVGFLRSLLERLPEDPWARAGVREAVAIKDAVAVERALDSFGDIDPGIIDPADRKALVNLTTFYGEEEVIEKASRMTTAPGASESLENLARVMEIIASEGCRDFVTIDLGEVRGFDYYTGIIFEGFASGVGKPILSGGRYDTLLEKYGYVAAATGFAFDVEQVVAALDRKGKE